MDKQTEKICRRRMHGLYCSGRCESLERLSSPWGGIFVYLARRGDAGGSSPPSPPFQKRKNMLS